MFVHLSETAFSLLTENTFAKLKVSIDGSKNISALLVFIICGLYGLTLILIQAIC